MADGSHIEWTDATWNPLVGCTKVSAGCDNCYAETDVTRRHAAALSPKTSPKMLEAFPAPFDVVSVRPDRFLLQPLRWRRPRRIFVNSLSDLFHADVPDDAIARVFAVMAATPRHTYQLLTKRHARMRSLLSSPQFEIAVGGALLDLEQAKAVPQGEGWTWPLPNVWIGVSVEDQHWADIRIPALLATPAAVRWISAEPLLGPLQLGPWLRPTPNCGHVIAEDGCCGHPTAATPECHTGVRCPLGDYRGIDWVVAGGESGPNARPMHPAWARALRDQCGAALVPFLFKQWGNWGPGARGGDIIDRPQRVTVLDMAGQQLPLKAWPPGAALLSNVGKGAAGRLLDGRTHDGYPVAQPSTAPPTCPDGAQTDMTRKEQR